MNKFFRWIITCLWAYLIWYLTTTPNFKVTDNSLLSAIISNGGHFFFFGVLAVLLAVPRFWSLVVVSSYGLLIELIQRTIPGRSFSLRDFALDALGAITFLFVLKKLQSSS